MQCLRGDSSDYNYKPFLLDTLIIYFFFFKYVNFVTRPAAIFRSD